MYREGGEREGGRDREGGEGEAGREGERKGQGGRGGKFTNNSTSPNSKQNMSGPARSVSFIILGSVL